MTDDERKLLSDLADKIAQTPPPVKDPDAEQFIRTRIGSRPDALYLMTQTVIVQNIALQQAQAQIQQLQQQRGSGQNFIPGAQQQTQEQQYSAPPPSYAAPAQSYPSPAPTQTGGFLRNAAQTAAGVAGGMLAVDAIESLFHHGMGSGYGYGGGSFFGGGGIGGYAPPIEENITNNYYEGAPQGGGDQSFTGDRGLDDFQATDNAQNFDDNPGSDYNDSSNDFTDNTGFDGGGGFDDSGNGGDSFL